MENGRQNANNPIPPQPSAWNKVLEAGVMAQRLAGDAVVVGGTAAALYAEHRLSVDADHLLPDLRERYDEILERVEACPDWSTARLQPPVLILGSLRGVDVGYRQLRRSLPVETATLDTAFGPLVVPTLDELIGMKAYLAYARRATRDFLDLAALASLTRGEEALSSLLKSDERYGELQTSSAALEIAKTLSDPKPFDLEETDLSAYKGLKPEWQDWSRIVRICQNHGKILGERLVLEE